MPNIIYQGDQYLLPIKIKAGDIQITPDIIDGLRVKLGKFEKRYPDGGVTFEDGVWYYPLTQQESRKFCLCTIPLQMELHFQSGDIVVTEQKKYKKGANILKGVWSNG